MNDQQWGGRWSCCKSHFSEPGAKGRGVLGWAEKGGNESSNGRRHLLNFLRRGHNRRLVVLILVFQQEKPLCSLNQRGMSPPGKEPNIQETRGDHPAGMVPI